MTTKRERAEQLAQQLKDIIPVGVKVCVEMQLTGDHKQIKVVDVDTGAVLWNDFDTDRRAE